MLYNVLPPLIFFASLGGTILVVSRVVLRIRRDQVAAELQSHVTKVSKNRLNKIQDLAGILAPNHISVHSFKNRISFMAHAARDTTVKAIQDTKDWRRQRAERKKQTKEEKKASKTATTKAKSAKIVNSRTDSIKPPTSRIRDQLKRIVTQSKNVSAKSQNIFKKYTTEAVDNIKSRQIQQRAEAKRPETEDKKQEIEPAKPVTSDNKKTPVISMLTPAKSDLQQKQSKPKAKLKAGTSSKPTPISKFFNKKEDKNKDVLELAKEALEDAQTQKAEDILVPYIVNHPTNTSAYMMLGKAAICRKNWTEATEIFEQVARIKPETKGCYAALGQAALESGNLTKAIEALQRAHDQSPQDTQVIKRLIKIATRMDNQPMQRSLTEELKILKKEKTLENQAT